MTTPKKHMFEMFPSEMHRTRIDIFKVPNVEHELKIMSELFDGCLTTLRPAVKEFVKNIITMPEPVNLIYDPKEEIIAPYAYERYKFFPGTEPTTLEKIFNCHHGQRKLFLAEAQVIFQAIKALGPKIRIVYAGAAPGHHTIHLFSLFPEIELHLYDPAPFDSELAKDSRVFLYNEFFTDDVAKKWADKCNVFICDVRVPSENLEENEQQITDDMNMQMKWTQIINADFTSLKFRPPYINNDSDREKHANYSYIGGEVYWGIYPPVQSTEGRLIATKKDISSGPLPFNAEHYQDACCQHNIRRIWQTCKPFAGASNVPGFDRCVDCAMEAEQWRIMIEHGCAPFKSIAECMNWLTEICGQALIYIVKTATVKTSVTPGIKVHGMDRTTGRVERIKRLLEIWRAHIAHKNKHQEAIRAEQIKNSKAVFKGLGK